MESLGKGGAARAQGLAVECGAAYPGWNPAYSKTGANRETKVGWGQIIKISPCLADESSCDSVGQWRC